ncbi:MAG TPA: DUF4157 domain-containing protein, partial [Pyrinomonadaceae bacterium]
MNGRTAVQAQVAAPKPTPAQAGLLRRKCACGTHTIGGGECDECSRRQTLQRRPAPAGEGAGEGVPQAVHDVLGSPGHALDADARAFFESHFGHDFSGVRVHTDAKAA